MKSAACPREIEIARAARVEVTSPEIHEHLRSCTDCREVFSVATSLRAFASTTSTAPTEPFALAPGRVWWKAEIAKERATAREAMSAVRAVEIGGPVAAACVLAGWAGWRWEDLRPVVETWVHAFPGGRSSSIASVLLATAAAAVTLAVAAVALRPLTVRDGE